MANLASAPLVNAKAYRHFAAVTFALTLFVALLANGEVSQAANDANAQQQQATRLHEANTKKFGAKRLGDRRAKAARLGSFGEDFDSSYGAVSDSGGDQPTSFAPDSGGAGESPVASYAPAGQPPILSPDDVARLTPAEQQAYVNRLRNQKSAAKQAPDPRDLAAIEASSRARSGSPEED